MQINDTIFSLTELDLPPTVRQLHQPVKNLTGRGNKSLLNTGKRVGIVGARKFTPYGREVTVDIASTLARAGVTIVSGLALGVDSIAHKACIDAGGKTIAVLPSGLDKIYPSSHNSLAKQILANQGLLISEFANLHTPMKHDFIQRNRIIAALSDVLIVTEAALASGSLHTANFALELGIDVMAVPGNITNPSSTGTNQLIQKGAFAILSPDDILHHLGIEQHKLDYLPENEIEESILGFLVSGSLSTNELVTLCGFELGTIQTQLTLLEIKGVIQSTAGNWSIS